MVDPLERGRLAELRARRLTDERDVALVERDAAIVEAFMAGVRPPEIARQVGVGESLVRSKTNPHRAARRRAAREADS